MDKQLLFLINREWTHPALDWVMVLLSSWGFWTPILAVVFILLAIRGGFRMRAFLLCAALTVGVTDGLVSKTLKRVFDRPRPHQAVADVRQLDLGKGSPRFLALGKPLKEKLSKEPDHAVDVDGRSMPSSHTANTAAVAVAAWRFFGRRAAWTFLLPIGVGYSRIYTGSHWPSDVLVSFILGCMVATAVLAGLAWLWRTQGARWFPALRASHQELFAA
jgi:undecaprenyl-diphosphatase